MFGKWLDDVIGVFAPAAAFKRSQYRMAYDRVRKRAYDAARQNRNTYNWDARTTSADRALRAEADIVRNRVRDLVRNNAHANGALEAIVANVVGCGIQPQIDNEAIRESWQRWCEEADLTGRLHFYEMQALALRETVEAGEVLVHYRTQPERADTRGISPLVLELVESERIDSSQDNSFGRITRTGEKFIRRGVELNPDGKAIGYWLYRYDPLDTIGGLTSSFVPASQVLHLYRQLRVGQSRGISWLAPVVMWLKDLGVYVENELQASAVASCFTVAIKTLDSGESFGGLAGPSTADSTDTDGNRFENIQPGLITHLMPGEDVSVINPTRQNAASGEWINLILRAIAVGTGLSYELVSRDYSQTDFSSNRASALEDRRRFKPLQKFLVWHLCRPVYEEWFRAGVLAGLPGFPSADEFLANPGGYLNVRWMVPGWEWVDPLKEAQAAKLAVETLFKSRTEVIAERGRGVEEVFDEIARENELMDARDLNPMEGELNDQAKVQEANEAEAQQAAA